MHPCTTYTTLCQFGDGVFVSFSNAICLHTSSRNTGQVVELVVCRGGGGGSCSLYVHVVLHTLVYNNPTKIPSTQVSGGAAADRCCNLLDS